MIETYCVIIIAYGLSHEKTHDYRFKRFNLK